MYSVFTSDRGEEQQTLFDFGCTGGSRPRAKGEGGVGVFVLLALPAFVPFVAISSFQKMGEGRGTLPAAGLFKLLAIFFYEFSRLFSFKLQ